MTDHVEPTIHIVVPGERELVACGEDRTTDTSIGTYDQVRAAGSAGCWACVDAYMETALMSESFRTRGATP